MSRLLTLHSNEREDGFPLRNLQGWWDVTQASTITKDGSNLVSQVNDISGQGNHLTSSGANRPTWLSSSDATAAIQSANKIMDATHSISNVIEETLFALVRVDNVANGAEYMFGVNGTGWGIFHAVGTPDMLNWTTQNSINRSGALRNLEDVNIGTHYKLLSFVRSVSNNFMAIYENGLLVKIDTHSVGTVTEKLQVGGRGSLRAEMSWKEILWYDRALTASNRQKIEQMLMQKYNVGQVPAAFAGALPAVKRAAIGQSYTSAGDFAKSASFIGYIGDSTCVGLAPKADFDSSYVKLYTDAYLYEWNISNDWLALDSRNAASHNNKGNAQSLAGMEGVLCEDIGAVLLQDIYIIKYAASGSHLANVSAPNNWNVANEGTFWLDYRAHLQDAINHAVMRDDVLLEALGQVVFLGTNDANDGAEASAVQSNLTALIQSIRGIGCVPSDMAVAICEIFSDSLVYTELSTVRAALVNVAGNVSNVTHIGGMDSTADTEDGTHPNAATYEVMGAAIAGLFTS